MFSFLFLSFFVLNFCFPFFHALTNCVKALLAPRFLLFAVQDLLGRKALGFSSAPRFGEELARKEAERATDSTR